ncbi:hypothetical protein KJ780_00700 [Candidatus Micrarchaeota archaeon]|nr:hypothetical protein [Candidatus Micrarchaeota archaeon]
MDRKWRNVLIIAICGAIVVLSFSLLESALISTLRPAIDDVNLINAFSAFGQVMGAIGTFIAILIALFTQELHSYFFKPNIQFIKHKDVSKYIIEVMESYSVHRGELEDELKTKQKRLAVPIVNKGNDSANNVRAYFTGLESNAIQDFDKYISIPLPQSWTKKNVVESVPVEVQTSWEICFIESLWPEQIRFWFYELHALQKITCKKGKKWFFIFRIDIRADNSSEVSQKIKISYQGNYSKGIQLEFL